ncbi:hypothetical protein J2W28_002883 [Variovorax boronicumulans]|uniref:hypothetical protein n=1 Tax=Variovorax boronicumulans TaxID=436515 RepID=UPI0027872D2C|nr:hypothetical protein [Variovorax boronicumulans]MDP9991706.1 hypothetical protein [Variovorax boronicumulans]MDQ0003734.1 hypothetical protein [Variovorax boronicumulans]MDQ0040884.1 hypothetical protein [Variovorax boronicumulans]
MQAQDVLPDGQDFVLRNGLQLRKGSVAAFLANAQLLQDPNATAEAKQAAERDLIALLPALEALGLFDVFELRSPALRDEVARHRAALISSAPAAAPRA